MTQLQRFFPRKLVLATLVAMTPVVTMAQDARAIMEKVDAASRTQNDNSFTVMQLSTCKFGVSGGKVKCAERPIVKKLESAGITFGQNGKDSKSIAIVLEPASERGIGMLSYAYDDPNKDNETWLYLSALGKVKRIVASNSSANSEPVSVFGSEFTTEDQETGKLDDYSFKLLDTVTYQGRKAYVIEQIASPARAKKTRYPRSISWIDAERNIMLKAEMYDSRGNEVRRVVTSKHERINGVWIARSITIMNLVSNRLSNMALGEIHFGVQIDPELMTQRALTDKAFRERQLDQLRAQAR